MGESALKGRGGGTWGCWRGVQLDVPYSVVYLRTAVVLSSLPLVHLKYRPSVMTIESNLMESHMDFLDLSLDSLVCCPCYCRSCPASRLWMH